MNPRLSVLLDCLRLAAAIAVVCAHLPRTLFPGTPEWLSGHGQEAVSIFFVLSGYVIAYSSDARPGCWRSYAKARAARLYSVVLPVLFAIFVADGIGQHFNPAFYAAQGGGASGASLHDILATLSFTNELWFRHVVVGTAEPFWSLGFEVPYYLLFGILLFTGGRVRFYLCTAWALLVGPRILLYLPLWLLGVAAFHLVKREADFLTERLVWTTLAAIPLAYLLWHGSYGRSASVQLEWTSAPEAVANAGYHFGVGLLAAFAIVAVSVVTRGRPPFPIGSARGAQWLAGASFTLYLAHLPLLVFASAMMSRSASTLERAAWLGGVMVAVLLLAEVGERRKREFGRAGSELLRRLGELAGRLRLRSLPAAD